jgi:hypothetical protein
MFPRAVYLKGRRLSDRGPEPDLLHDVVAPFQRNGGGCRLRGEKATVINPLVINRLKKVPFLALISTNKW